MAENKDILVKTYENKNPMPNESNALIHDKSVPPSAETMQTIDPNYNAATLNCKYIKIY